MPPIDEGMVVKGGRNQGQSQIRKRPAPPGPVEPDMFQPTPLLLTFRKSPRGNLTAAYRGAIRVGYISFSSSVSRGETQKYVWQLNLLSPTGNNPVGRSTTEEEGQRALTSAFTEWLAHAGLQPKENIK